MSLISKVPNKDWRGGTLFWLSNHNYMKSYSLETRNPTQDGLPTASCS